MINDINTSIGVTEKYTSLFYDNIIALEAGSSLLFNNMREGAMERFEKIGVPGPGNEDYKYTDLTAFFSRDSHTAFSYDEARIGDVADYHADIDGLDAYTAMVVNGWYHKGNEKASWLPEGVVAGSIMQIAAEKPQLMKDWLNRLAGLSDDPMVALNTAFAKDGFFLYVPDNNVIEKPIRIINLLNAREDAFSVQRNLIIVGNNSSVKIIFCDYTSGASAFLSDNVTEVFAGRNAIAEVYALQKQNDLAGMVNSLFIKQEEGSHFVTGIATLQGGLIRNNLNICMNGSNAETHALGMTVADKNQHIDNFTNIEHARSDCMSNQLYKNILDDNATGVFSGCIHVARDAQKTNAFQRNNNIVLTDTARMDTKPQLIIDADDVKCSHGATVGQIDKDALFYLQARGIDGIEARTMLMNAFTDEVIREIRIEPLRDHISMLMGKRLRGETL